MTSLLDDRHNQRYVRVRKALTHRPVVFAGSTPVAQPVRISYQKLTDVPSGEHTSIALNRALAC